MFVVLLALCGGIAAHTVFRRVRVILAGLPTPSPEPGQSALWQRLWNLLIYVPGQWSNIRNIRLKDTAGLTHLFLFWGFYSFAFNFAVYEVLHEGLGLFGEIRKAPASTLFMAVLDVLSALLVLALVAAVTRRAVLKLKRLGPHFEVTPMALLALAGTLMMACFFSLQGLRHNLDMAIAGPVSGGFAVLYAGLEQSTQLALCHGMWWAQAFFILVAVVYIPFSRHQHPIFAPFNFLFRQERNRGQLHKINVVDITDATGETNRRFGAKYESDLNRKQLLDLYSCTQCGRCQDVCPAADTGKPLSPKAVVNDLMHHVDEQAGLLPFWEPPKGTETLADAIGRDSLWSCTTCQACNEVCPVGVEPMQKVLEVRRDQVMNDADMPAELVELYRNLEISGDPWGYGAEKRTIWTEGLDIPVLSEMKPGEMEQIDLLFWVGCTGAFDDQYRGTVRSFARVLKQAGVKFAVLGSEERCTGDTARRTGNEWLYQELAGKNVENFIKYGIKRVVTTCPHCFNTLKNEYSEFGLELEVLHHTELMDSMMKGGDLQVTRPLDKEITFHDPCYLGRYNNQVDAPREILGKLGATLVEPSRTKAKSRCCGAGGGMMQLGNEVGTRVNEDRAEELLSCGSDTLVTGCPFCHQMVDSGVAAVDKESKVQTVDIVRLVEQATVAAEKPE